MIARVISKIAGGSNWTKTLKSASGSCSKTSKEMLIFLRKYNSGSMAPNVFALIGWSISLPFNRSSDDWMSIPSLFLGSVRSLPKIQPETESCEQPLSKESTEEHRGQQSQYEDRCGILGRLIGGHRHRTTFVRSGHDQALVHQWYAGQHCGDELFGRSIPTRPDRVQRPRSTSRAAA